MTQERATVAIPEFTVRFLDRERIRGYCKACKNYGKRNACPPFETELDLSKFTSIEVIVRTVPIDDGTLESAFREARPAFDEYLLSLEEPNKLCMYAGSCLKKCNCASDKSAKCKCRVSLEAVGFDVIKIASELFNIDICCCKKDPPIPKRATLVGAVLIGS